MKSDVFIAKFASGAIAASVAGGWMSPQRQTDAPVIPMTGGDTVFAANAPTPEEGTEITESSGVTMTFTESLSEWDKKLEREFRGLAMAEARGTLSEQESNRLEELTGLRNRLLHGQTAEEISLQLKRDRLLARMESLLREYVEFQETANQKRATA
jgi:hypothetical protein